MDHPPPRFFSDEKERGGAHRAQDPPSFPYKPGPSPLPAFASTLRFLRGGAPARGRGRSGAGPRASGPGSQDPSPPKIRSARGATGNRVTPPPNSGPE